MTNHHNDAPDCAGRNGAPAHGKHTPGPWVVDPCWDILGNTDDGNGMVCQITTDAVPRAEAEANARLIAAAPELLEALRDLAREAARNIYPKPDVGPEHPCSILRRADAAIARATGAA